MNREELIKLIEKEFSKKVLLIVYLDGIYYFSLENDTALNYTMNIRYYDEKIKKFDLFNRMDDFGLTKRLNELAEKAII